MTTENSNKKRLKKADSATVTTIIDNYIDTLLPSGSHVQRAPLRKGNERRPPLLAEHGFSVLVELEGNDESHAVLMDFGISSVGVPNNLQVLEIDLEKIEAFVVSHGHHDHVGAIEQVLGSISHKPRPVVVHPDAFLQSRFHLFPDGTRIPIPGLKSGLIEKTGNTVVDGTFPVFLASDYLLALGEIPMVNDFEKGMPTAYYEKNGEVIKDWIRDDKAIVLNVKNRGLVIITGCGHSGIINTVTHAREITGIDQVYCIMGGFHLTGNIDETVVKRTIEEFKKFDADIIVPCHCTGLDAAEQFKHAFPSEFIMNASGTKILL